MDWSKPYFGVSHLQVKSPRFQYTVTSYSEDLHKADVIHKHALTLDDHRVFSSLVAAKEYLEQRVRQQEPTA